MPIRFQVDPDFYDHPKVTGMTDAAFSLWVRAGSYSAAKLTDGFIAEHVLVHTLRSSVDVAGELAHRGLWRRVKGGYQFHEWGLRNLTKQRVEDEKEADRERKRRERDAARKAAGQNVNGQARQGNVRPDSNRIPSGVPPDSEGIPASSVSVSVSSSVSGSGRGDRRGPPPFGDEPPHRCPEHLDDPYPPPCGKCAEARRAHERWERERDLAKAEWERTAPRCPRHRGQLAHNCQGCRSEQLGGVDA